MPSPRVVVIGTGIAGLCTAVYARKCGYQVQVIEQHDSAGGLATSWRRGDYIFGTCLHWFTGANPKRGAECAVAGGIRCREAEICVSRRVCVSGERARRAGAHLLKR